MEKVRKRLLKACDALERAGIPYGVAGGNAVAAWVSTVDEAAVRNTRDVDVMVRRHDLDSVREALEDVGFIYRHVGRLDVFLETPDGSIRDAVHLIFAGEFVKEGEAESNPGLEAIVNTGEFRVLDLASLVQIKLTAFRDKDRMHLRDMIDVGLIDKTWLDRVPGLLSDRLREILDNPEG